MDELKAKQKAFVEQLPLNQWNGTQAAIAAGYSANGAAVTACRLLKKPAVAKELERRSDEIEQKTGVDVAEIITALRDIAFGKKKATNTERLRALELLGKYKAMFTERKDDGARTYNVVDILALVGVGGEQTA